MSNHLIIGLGGTGGKIIRELRKRIYEEYKDVEPQGNNVHVDYVYVDSSLEDLNDRTKWRVMGKSVHLGEAQKVSINGISTAMLNNLSLYPGLKAFVNQDDKMLMDEHMGGLITTGIGGQRRRLGRILLANNLCDASNPHNLNKVIHGAVQRLWQKSHDNDITFHICTGLAGGTGSGSVVDVIAQLREKYPADAGHKNNKIRLFLYVPEKIVENPKHDSGYYQANGYAALKELNAISTGYYRPVDVTGTPDVFTQEVRRLLEGGDAFETAYLYTNMNSLGKKLELEEELPRAVADFIFQTVIAGQGAGELKRLVDCENNGGDPEVDTNGQPTRSRRFMSMGITRVEYPEAEIDEYVSYNYAIQASRQLTYNFWQEGLGFGEKTLDEVGSGYLDEIKDKKNRELLMLSNSHLTLGRCIIETTSSKKWKDLAVTWETRTTQDAGFVEQQFKKEQWMPEFTTLIDDYYNNNFRAHGVKKFYEIQRQETKAYAAHIRRHIEGILFKDWQAGTKSILEVEKYASLLSADCAGRMDTFRQQVSRQEDMKAEAMATISAQKDEWKNIGWLRDALTNKASKVFKAYVAAKCDYCLADTRIEAYNYAVALLTEIKLQIDNMIQGVQAFRGELTEIMKEVKRQAESRCQINENTDKDSRIKKYDPEKVALLTRQYSINEEYQRSNADKIRNAMVETLGEDGERSFAALYDSVDYNTASDIIINICVDSARAAMAETAVKDPLNRMVGVNILDKLAAEYNTDEKLEAFVKKVIGYATEFLPTNTTEQAMVLGGQATSTNRMVQLAIPREGNTNQQNAFADRLIRAFSDEVPGFNAADCVAQSVKPNQLVVICSQSGFPLRYVDNLTVLKQKYDQLTMSPQAELKKMELHTESGLKLPELYEKIVNIVEAERLLMLAMALELVQTQSDPITGESFLAYKEHDDIFGDKWTKLGKGFNTAAMALKDDAKLYNSFEGTVERELATKARSNDQKRQLQMKVGAVVQKVILPTICEGNQFDPRYNNYKNMAMGIINKELKPL